MKPTIVIRIAIVNSKRSDERPKNTGVDDEGDKSIIAIDTMLDKIAAKRKNLQTTRPFLFPFSE